PWDRVPERFGDRRLRDHAPILRSDCTESSNWERRRSPDNSEKRKTNCLTVTDVVAVATRLRFDRSGCCGTWPMIASADSTSSSYPEVAALLSMGVDVVMRQHGGRPTDFRRGQKLGR